MKVAKVVATVVAKPFWKKFLECFFLPATEREIFSVSEFAIFSKFQKCHSMCYCESEEISRKIFLRAR